MAWRTTERAVKFDVHTGQGEQKSYQLPPDLRQPESHVPPRAGAAPAGARRARYGSRRPDRRFGVVLTRCPCFLPPTPSTRRGTGRSPRREDAIENALKAKLQARAAQRRAQEMMARQAAKELEEFTNEFKNAARHCFELIDVDKGGSLSKEEMSARCVRPSTRARRGDGAAALVVRRVWGGSLYAIDATRRLPPDPSAASTPSTLRRGSRRERGVLQPSIRDLRNCCFRVFGVWWCGIGLQ